MKYALVTGSARGIGYATAKKLTENGYFVFANGINSDGIYLQDSKYIKADLSTVQGAKALLSAINGIQLDCVVFNTGATCKTKFGEVTYEAWQKVMDTNVNIPVYLVQHLNIIDGGNIAFIASAMGLKPHATSLAYGVSKAAAVSLAQNLVKEFAERKIRVNAICPGFIDTDWQKEKPEWLKIKIENKIALKRFGTPEEVADLVMSVAGNNYLNGSVLSLDGGYDYE